ncbi:sulfotransferase [Vibrio fortis]|uniref:sulfotransferase n=1 Tax=Vibrio fortis TaxID=212667 RepID=UPI0021C4A413|nr:sulfotransferase [Vibrio fortis]
MNHEKDMQVVILGMHRSGTSILSKVLSSLGVNMGEFDEKIYISNVEGHFEDLRMLEINERILKNLQCSWDKPPSIERIRKNKSWIAQEYNDYIKSKKGIWGVKEPRLSLFSDIFCDLTPNARIIYCLRDENEVAKSLNVREGMPIETGLELKKIYDETISASIRGRDYLLVEYTKLTQNPDEVLKEICQFLSLEYTKTAIEHIKRPNDLKNKKREVLAQSMYSHIITAIREPRKIFRKETLNLMALYFRRIREVI